MGNRVFLFRRELGEGLGEAIGNEERIVAETARPRRRGENAPRAMALDRVFLSGGIDQRDRAGEARRAIGDAFEVLEEERVVLRRVPSSPAYRALKTPGAPPSAFTSSPESSAMIHAPGCRAFNARALISAFPMNVDSVSSAFESSAAISQPGSISPISRTLCALWVESIIFIFSCFELNRYMATVSTPIRMPRALRVTFLNPHHLAGLRREKNGTVVLLHRRPFTHQLRLSILDYLTGENSVALGGR